MCRVIQYKVQRSEGKDFIPLTDINIFRLEAEETLQHEVSSLKGRSFFRPLPSPVHLLECCHPVSDGYRIVFPQD